MNVWLEDILIFAGIGLFMLLLRAYTRTERWQRAYARLRRDRLGMISLGVIFLYVMIGLADSIVLPARDMARPESLLDICFSGVPMERGYSAPLASTSYSGKPESLKGWHLLGTDLLGKDVFEQTLKGCRTALVIGGMTSLIYIPLGTLLGIAAGYYRRRVDDIIQYLYSTIASIPNILLLIAILLILGRGLGWMAVALSITAWVGICRLVRGETFRQASRPYVDAARALGQRDWKIVVKHILPNVMHLVVINLVLGLSGLILAESILSYLGVGAPVGVASWGIMIDSARMELSREPIVWWNLAGATGALFFLVLSLNLLGDSLRRAFDPKSA